MRPPVPGLFMARSQGLLPLRPPVPVAFLGGGAPCPPWQGWFARCLVLGRLARGLLLFGLCPSLADVGWLLCRTIYLFLLFSCHEFES